MDKDIELHDFTGICCTHCRHPEFTSGSHEIEADTGLKRHTKPIEFSTMVEIRRYRIKPGMTAFLAGHN